MRVIHKKFRHLIKEKKLSYQNKKERVRCFIKKKEKLSTIKEKGGLDKFTTKVIVIILTPIYLVYDNLKLKLLILF